MGFLISSLPKLQFQHLFELPDDHLAPLRAVRMVATEKPGFPCRVSLKDAEVGEELILLNYEHHGAETPYRSSHAIFVRQTAEQAMLERNEVPEMLRLRILSLRGFDGTGTMLHADLADGRALEAAIEQIFSDTAVKYIHIHFAKPGCYAACAVRA